MVAEVFGGISAFKTMLDIAKSLKDMNNIAARQAAVIELQEQILSAQAAQSELSEEVRSLKAEMAKLKNWESEKQEYELKNLGGASFAYMLKPEMRGSKPAHWICTRCYGDGQAEIIQQIPHGIGRDYICPRCRSEINPSQMAFETERPKWL